MTVEQGPEAALEQGRWDALIGELQALRLLDGEPSYAELTRRLIAQRVAAGQDEHSARIAKSSVYDAFRLGRSRINVPLTREIAELLGADPSLVDQWMTRVERAAKDHPAPTPAPVPPAVPTVVPQGHSDQLDPGLSQVLLLLAGCLALNLLGRLFVDFLALPIYLDMVGTAIAAIALGPWRGASVGLATNLIGAIGSGWISIPFVLVNVVGALVWGYGVRRWDMGRTLLRFFVLNLTVALSCSVVAVPILLTLVGDRLRSGHQSITALVQDTGGSFEVAVAFSNVLTSAGDKLISGFVALVVLSSLPLALRRGFRLALVADPRPDP